MNYSKTFSIIIIRYEKHRTKLFVGSTKQILVVDMKVKLMANKFDTSSATDIIYGHITFLLFNLLLLFFWYLFLSSSEVVEFNFYNFYMTI